MSSQVWWYVARGSGLVAWGLLTGAVALGLWLSLRLTRNRPRPAWTLDLHRFLGGLAVVFTGVHLAGLVADSYVEFGAVELFVPFAPGWKSSAVALGVIALYLLLAIEVTSLLMRRLPRRLWRGVHLSSYVLFVLATAHLVAAGTDVGHWLVQWGTLVGTSFVAFLTVARVLATRGRQPRAVTTPRRDAGRPAPARTRPAPAASTPR